VRQADAELIAADAASRNLLIAAQGTTPAAVSFRGAFAERHVEIEDIAEVGSHAARFDFVRDS
jgi:hypothetical protein